eukprot:1138718-Pelagomonas_calceolata.AAC.3
MSGTGCDTERSHTACLGPEGRGTNCVGLTDDRRRERKRNAVGLKLRRTGDGNFGEHWHTGDEILAEAFLGASICQRAWAHVHSSWHGGVQ